MDPIEKFSDDDSDAELQAHRFTADITRRCPKPYKIKAGTPTITDASEGNNAKKMLRDQEVLRWLSIENTVTQTLTSAIAAQQAGRRTWLLKRKQLDDLFISFAMDSKGDEARYVQSVIEFMDTTATEELKKLDTQVAAELERKPPTPLSLTKPPAIWYAEYEASGIVPLPKVYKKRRM